MSLLETLFFNEATEMTSCRGRQEALADSFSAVLHALAEKHRVRRYRDGEGFRAELSRADRATEASLEHRLLSVFINAVAAQEAVAATETIAPTTPTVSTGRKSRRTVGE